MGAGGMSLSIGGRTSKVSARSPPTYRGCLGALKWDLPEGDLPENPAVELYIGKDKEKPTEAGKI